MFDYCYPNFISKERLERDVSKRMKEVRSWFDEMFGGNASDTEVEDNAEEQDEYFHHIQREQDLIDEALVAREIFRNLDPSPEDGYWENNRDMAWGDPIENYENEVAMEEDAEEEEEEEVGEPNEIHVGGIDHDVW